MIVNEIGEDVNYTYIDDYNRLWGFYPILRDNLGDI